MLYLVVGSVIMMQGIGGYSPDGRYAVGMARDHTVQFKDAFGEEMCPRVLAERMGQFVHQFTCYGGARPLGINLLFAGYDPVDGGEPIANEAILEQLHALSMKDATLQHPWEQNALEITFLRNLIWSKNNTEAFFHTKLVLLYMSSISSLQENVEMLQR